MVDALAWLSDGSDDLETPKKQRRPRHPCRPFWVKKKGKDVPLEIRCRCVKVPEQRRLLEYIHAEKETGGCPPVLEESQEKAEQQRVPPLARKAKRFGSEV